MSKHILSHRRQPALVLGASLGLAGAGVAALLVGGLYYQQALLFSFDDVGGMSVFLPVVVTSICCVGLLGRRRRSAAIVLALFSAAGLVAMLLPSQWGMGTCDGDPERMKRFGRFTYVSDVLFCFAYSVQLAAGAVLLLRTRGGSRGDHV